MNIARRPFQHWRGISSLDDGSLMWRKLQDFAHLRLKSLAELVRWEMYQNCSHRFHSISSTFYKLDV